MVAIPASEGCDLIAAQFVALTRRLPYLGLLEVLIAFDKDGAIAPFRLSRLFGAQRRFPVRLAPKSFRHVRPQVLRDGAAKIVCAVAVTDEVAHECHRLSDSPIKVYDLDSR